MTRIQRTFLLVLLVPLIARAQSPGPATAKQGANRSVPEHTAPQIGLRLSENPSEEEIRSARIFFEPLIPVGRKPSAQENHQLAAALRLYQQRPAADDFSSLDRFLETNPDS